MLSQSQHVRARCVYDTIRNEAEARRAHRPHHPRPSRAAKRLLQREEGLSPRAIRRLDKLTKKLERDGADATVIEATIATFRRRFRHRVRP